MAVEVDAEQLNRWVLDELPRLNRSILAREVHRTALTDVLTGTVLPALPPVSGLTPAGACRLLVHLGFIGASVARHYQEDDPAGTATPERAFAGLAAGADAVPFRRYFGEVADRTGTGHYERDSFASLVRWNVPTVEVALAGHPVARISGVFDDDRIRTYTGTAGEELFFELVKKGEAIEKAVNAVLEPLTEPGARFGTVDSTERVRTAAVLLDALRRLLVDFAALPPDRGMPTDHFLDVFRQFAVHWTPNDIPPSGALDAEALKRDFLLGIAVPDYADHVRRLFPALLDGERADLDRLMGQPTLPERVADALGVDLAQLPRLDEAGLRRLVGAVPVLVDWYRLLSAHARAAGAHLMLSKKFLFKPQARRDLAGLGDRALVSNRRGTTGMTESFLDRLTRARQAHALAPLHAAQKPQSGGKDGAAEVRSVQGRGLQVTVQLLPASSRRSTAPG